MAWNIVINERSASLEQQMYAQMGLKPNGIYKARLSTRLCKSSFCGGDYEPNEITERLLSAGKLLVFSFVTHKDRTPD